VAKKLPNIPVTKHQMTRSDVLPSENLCKTIYFITVKKSATKLQAALAVLLQFIKKSFTFQKFCAGHRYHCTF